MNQTVKDHQSVVVMRHALQPDTFVTYIFTKLTTCRIKQPLLVSFIAMATTDKHASTVMSAKGVSKAEAIIARQAGQINNYCCILHTPVHVNGAEIQRSWPKID